MPLNPEPGDLHNKDTIVVEEVVDLLQELGVSKETHVLQEHPSAPRDYDSSENTNLAHLKTDNLVKLPVGRDIPVITAQNPRLLRAHTIIPDPVISKRGLVFGKRNTRRVSTKVLRSVRDEGSPSTANIEEAVTGLEVKLVTYNLQLVVLELLEGFVLGGVADDTGSVDHAWAEEPEKHEAGLRGVTRNILRVKRTYHS